MAWRPSSSKAQAAAVIDYGRDFSLERSALPTSLNPIVDEIEESLRQKPVDPTDHLQHGAEEGTMLIRRRNGVYVAFQRRIHSPAPPFRVCLWYCGTYRESGSRVIYDFEEGCQSSSS